MASARETFNLTKWYADVVSADGDVFMGYSAQLRWPPVSVSYESALECDGFSVPNSRTSFRRGRPPVVDAASGILQWNSARLKFSGTWIPLCEPVIDNLLSTDDGEIIWSCHIPSATVSLRTEEGHTMTGLGYAEHLSMSLPPWRLPIQELRWGRFLAGEEAIVWIDWDGSVPKRIGFRNGKPVRFDSLDDRELRLEDGARLILDQRRTLRAGELGSNVLRSLPGIERFAATKMLAAHETKWLSEGVFSRHGANDCRGWAIHEAVRWP